MCLLLFYVLAADNSPIHVLVEFIGDECVGVAPVHHILHCDVNNLGSGDKVRTINGNIQLDSFCQVCLVHVPSFHLFCMSVLDAFEQVSALTRRIQSIV